jgi:hypothetical protein
MLEALRITQKLEMVIFLKAFQNHPLLNLPHSTGFSYLCKPQDHWTFTLTFYSSQAQILNSNPYKNPTVPVYHHWLFLTNLKELKVQLTIEPNLS